MKPLALSEPVTHKSTQVMTTTLPTIYKQMKPSNSRQKLQPVFENRSEKSQEKESNPYLSIDMDRFEIVPAVPGLKIPVKDNQGCCY